ncbi:ferrochelatase [Ectothiorhodosinus mongolicus]|uniref:Ferrochelatase n=1 Tax=Ectothiorhodosinus mongolicus TaxID=233100 RepID=A0A1R3VV76_9GAMM|nr:ferrochelatase [Ectothiorhodosinus mongolicus]ULX56887.1 ferrochelatase [Ectothiorhodosinus mongolicus]SIT68814.1 ferrochelatase [Ectothiorhodosinus mongolicus]
MNYLGEPDYRHGTPQTLGILVTNLGTPDAPTRSALRRYLKQFLWDPRVVDAPRPLWWVILNGIILNTRPQKSAAKYASIWWEEGSPLLVITKRQQEGLQERLSASVPGPVKVAIAMRYGNPSIAAGLDELRRAGARRILILPMYPQYAASTTASTFDEVTNTLRQWRWVPEVRFVMSYHTDPHYIQSVANSIREYWAEHGEADHLLFSFHGIPQKYLEEGDPYHCFCRATARLVTEKLGMANDSDRWSVCFQSRFGKAQWLTPYTQETIKGLPAKGVKSLHVVCPGFSADCLETLEEIADEGEEDFLHAGGEKFGYIPALNARDDHMDAVAAVIQQHIQGWPEAQSDYDGESLRQEGERARERALAIGSKN